MVSGSGFKKAIASRAVVLFANRAVVLEFWPRVRVIYGGHPPTPKSIHFEDLGKILNGLDTHFAPP